VEKQENYEKVKRQELVHHMYCKVKILSCVIPASGFCLLFSIYTYLVLQWLSVCCSRWLLRENINPLCLTFENIQWELPFLKQPDPLFKFYVGCALLVLLGMLTIQCLGLPRYSLQELVLFLSCQNALMYYALHVRKHRSTIGSSNLNFVVFL
jgi:hypothetical protein